MPRQGAVQADHDPAVMAQTGITGLDDVLNGGLARGRLYLVEGVPGSGKTTLAMQFLMEGARRGEPVLYEVRQAISVVKKRSGVHERTIREFGMTGGSITVGDPLRHFRGVLTGVPVFEGSTDPLIETERRE